MAWFSLGKLSFPASWPAALAGFIAAYVFLLLWKKKVEADVYGNTIFTFILTWKLSVLLFSFKLTIHNPVGILYFNGGTKGVLLGVAAAGLYFVFWGAARISKPGRASLVPAWFTTVAVSVFVLHLFEGQAGMLSAVFLLANAVFVCLAAYEKKPGGALQYLVLFTGVQVLFQSIIGEFFSPLTAIYIGVALALAVTLEKGSAAG